LGLRQGSAVALEVDLAVLTFCRWVDGRLQDRDHPSITSLLGLRPSPRTPLTRAQMAALGDVIETPADA